jgi:hypothetical protein
MLNAIRPGNILVVTPQRHITVVARLGGRIKAQRRTQIRTASGAAQIAHNIATAKNLTARPLPGRRPYGGQLRFRFHIK